MTDRLLVVFGVSGDLFSIKLAPSLARLHAAGLTARLQVLGVSRKPWSDQDFRDFTAQKCRDAGVEPTREFLETLTFMTGDVQEDETYPKLFDEVGKRREAGVGDVLFYLSIAPKLYEPIFMRLSDTDHNGIIDAHTWLRIIVEKPYGVDTAHAERLDAILSKRFPQDCVYRIDHYLMKETMQDILTFRSSNELFRPLWNREHIHDITVAMHETVTIKKRADFYDAVGALRDVGQNHVLQMLSAVMMEEPKSFRSEDIRTARAAVIRDLIVRPDVRMIRGQYAGYRMEEGVPTQSMTETFFSVGAEVESDRWRGVPIYLQEGKGLSIKESYIRIRFKAHRDRVCPIDAECDHYNEVVFTLFPKEGITIKLVGKKPGIDAGLEDRILSYSIQDGPTPPTHDTAYDQVFYDAVRGDTLLFASSAEVRHAWRFVDDVIKTWNETKLIEYPVGSTVESLLG
jgi:glucose-6-phosphate 1-dehydrogenase